MTGLTPDWVYVETSIGKGYITEVQPDPRGRYAHTKYKPYVILADGTREDLPATPNLRGPLGDSAVGMLRDRLRETPLPPTPREPVKPCRAVVCQHFGHNHD